MGAQDTALLGGNAEQRDRGADAVVTAALANVIRLPTKTEELVLLTPGRYTAVYLRHSGLHFSRQPKLQVLFRLFEHPDIVLPRWYRVTEYRRRVRAQLHSDLVREVSAVLGTRIRHDRIPLASLLNIPVRVEVKTVTNDNEQRPLAEVNRYSVICRVEGRA